MQPDARRDSQGPYRTVPSIADWLGLRPDESHVQREHQAFLQGVSGAASSIVDQVVTRLARQAAAESVALEGFYELQPGQSRSIAVEENQWEDALGRNSTYNRGLFDSQLSAFEYVIEYAPKEHPISEKFIKELHAIACKAQEVYAVYTPSHTGGFSSQNRELKHGQYKDNPNNVTRRDGTTHWYAPVIDTPYEMDRFVQELNSESFAAASPLIQASYAHYALTHIHPFSDGNGRVARALASLYSYKNYGVPIIVYADRKLTYLQALERGASEDYGDIVDHMADRIADTLSHARQESKAIESSTAGVRLRKLMTELSSYRELSLGEAQKVAEELTSYLKSSIHEEVSELIANSEGNLTRITDKTLALAGGGLPTFSVTEHDLPYKVMGWDSVALKLTRPATVTAVVVFAVGMANDLAYRFPFCVVASGYTTISASSTVEVVRLRYEDCFPQLGGNAIDRIDMLVDAACAYVIDRLAAEINKILRQVGQL